MPKATLCVRGDLGAGKEKLLPMSVNRSVTKAFEPPPPRPPARVPCQSPPAEGAPRTKRQESKALDPGLRRGDESCPNAVPETKALHAAGNGEAEPAVAFPFCSAERSLRPAGIVASMSEPAGRVSMRPADCGRSEGTGESRRCGRGRFFASFLCRHKKGARPPGRDPANHRQPKAPQDRSGKDQKHWTPACAGATNRGRLPSPQRFPPAVDPHS